MLISDEPFTNKLFASFQFRSSISRRQYKQLTTLLTMSRDEDCQSDTATSPQGENFRPLQTVGGQNNNRQGNQQSVAHCTSDDFTVIIYESEDQ